jgi:hypothetical protein
MKHAGLPDPVPSYSQGRQQRKNDSAVSKRNNPMHEVCAKVSLQVQDPGPSVSLLSEDRTMLSRRPYAVGSFPLEL